MIKASIFPNSQVSVTKLKEYLQSTNQWISQTPERALEQAYQAALKIKSIENEYFDGGEISANSVNENSYLIMTVLQADLEKYLIITKLRLAEFNVSCSIIGTLNSAHLEKLKLIDEVLNKYIYKNKPSSLLRLSQGGKIVQAKLIVSQISMSRRLLTSTVQNFKTLWRSLSRRKPQHLHVNGYLITNLGMASTLFAGGFVLGEVSARTMLSAKNAAVHDYKNQNSVVEVHPNHAPAQTSNSNATVSNVSTPEIMHP